MKNNILIFPLCTLFNLCLLQAQETPKPPTPPASMPSLPELPEQLGAIAPPAKPMPAKKPDTTIISIGGRQIIIIDNQATKSGKEKAEWEEELEESMQELKESLEDVKEDMEDSKADMEESLEELEKSKEEGHHENEAPDDKHKYKLKFNKDKKAKKHTAGSIEFLEFDFGVNLLNVGSSVSKQMEDDLRLKTWGSWTYTFTFAPTKIYLGSRHLMLMTGLGWRIGQLEFKENLDFEPNKTLVYTKDEKIKKTQFMIHHLQIPLSIYWKSKRIRGLGDLGFGIGTYAGILISQELETATADPNRDIETNEDFGFTDFRYGVNARLDIGVLKLFANLDMNKLWKDNDIKNMECGIWIDF